VVLAFPDEPAYAYTLDELDGSPSVADLNSDYGASGRVATAAYVSDLDHHAPDWRECPVGELAALVEDAERLTAYTFPLDRLRAVGDREDGENRPLIPDGGAATDADGSGGAGGATRPYGVLDEDAVGDERAAHERAGWLYRTTDLDKRAAAALAWSEMGYFPAPIARELGCAPTTVEGDLERVVAQYGLRAVETKTHDDRGALDPMTVERLDDLAPAVREQYRDMAVENPGVVPGQVMAALSGGPPGDTSDAGKGGAP
jgi:hypothetical protein